MKKTLHATIFAALLAISPLPALADGAETQGLILRAESGGKAAPASTATASDTGAAAAKDDSVIRLTPDATKILSLAQDAASVIINNPRHIGVALENPRLLVIMPKEPGTTSFTVLDGQGQTIMERRVIVSSLQQKYIRVRRMCGDAANCTPSSYFYCPDGCYEVNPVPAAEGVSDVPEVAGTPAAPLTVPAPAPGEELPATAAPDSVTP